MSFYRLAIAFTLALFLLPLAVQAEDVSPVTASEEEMAEEAPEARIQSSDSEALEELEESLEEDIAVKHTIEQRRRARRERSLLPANSPGKEVSESIPMLQSMEELHEDLSEDIVGLADNIDSFFVNQQIVEGRNRTNARISNGFSFIDETGYQNDFDFKFRLRLPGLKQKLSLEFEDDYNDNTSVGNNNVRANNLYSTRPDGASRGGLSYFESLKGFDAKLTGGLEWNNGAVAYGRFRIQRNFVINKWQKLTFIHDYFDDTEARRGQFAIFNYDFSLNKSLILRFLNEELYKDEFHTFETGHGLSLFHTINDRNIISYNFRLNSLNAAGDSSFFINAYVLNVIYRHSIYKKFLFGDIGPALLFPKEDDWEGQPAITFRIELILGNI